MTDQAAFDAYCEEAPSLGLWTKSRRLKTYATYLFEGVSLKDRDFLDVGGGTGVFSGLAVALGAKGAVCLEPESAGADKTLPRIWEGLRNSTRSNWEKVCFEASTLDDYVASRGSDRAVFDVALMHNTINHLNEAACLALPAAWARVAYIAELKKLRSLMAKGGILIVCDCSSSNLFPDLGLTNPFMRTIDWRKHAPPELWTSILAESGFKTDDTAWTSFNPLGRPGRWLLGHRLGAYFTLGHFKLRCRAC